MATDRIHQQFFDRHAPTWDEEENAEKIAALQKVFESLGQQLCGNILDLGCGTGILVPLVRQFGSDFHLYELDLSLSMIRQNSNRWQTDRHLFRINADAHRLPFPPAKFDSLLCFAALPHFANQSVALQEFTRVLKPDGFLVVLHLMSSTILNRYHRLTDPAVARDRLPTVSELAAQLNRLGFAVLRKTEKEDLYLVVAKNTGREQTGFAGK